MLNLKMDTRLLNNGKDTEQATKNKLKRILVNIDSEIDAIKSLRAEMDGYGVTLNQNEDKEIFQAVEELAERLKNLALRDY